MGLKQLALLPTCLTRTAVCMIFLSAATPIFSQSWTQLAPTGGPPTARQAHSAVLDTAAQQMIIFGGSADFNDVWSLTLGAIPQWRQLSPSGTLPPGRTGHSAVYDSTNSRMVIFGGGLGQSSPCSRRRVLQRPLGAFKCERLRRHSGLDATRADRNRAGRKGGPYGGV
jgi:hypothetical protein